MVAGYVERSESELVVKVYNYRFNFIPLLQFLVNKCTMLVVKLARKIYI